MKLRFLLAALCSAFLFAGSAAAQSANARVYIERANKQTLPGGTKRIEEETGAKVVLEVDAASYGDDEKAWGNLNIIVSRIVGAILEIGKDQVGKDAIARSIKRVVIVKSGLNARNDAVELKDGTLTVKTAGDDEAGNLLQGIVTKALESAL